MSGSSHVPETAVNINLARILSKDFKIDARAERQRGGKRPDIKCYYKGLCIGIEASYDRKDAEEDAKRRIEQGLVDLSLALWLKVRYPDVPEDKLERLIGRSKFDVKVFIPKEAELRLIPFLEDRVNKEAEQATKWFTDVDLPTIRGIMEASLDFLIKEDEVEKLIANIKQKIGDFVNSLSSIDAGSDIYGKIYGILYKLYGLSIAEAGGPDVIFGQAALSILLSTIFYERIRNVNPQLLPVKKCVDTYGPIEGLKEAFKDLLKIDYKTAVKATVDILSTLPPDISRRVGDLTDLAVNIASQGEFRKDLAGRIYHEIAGDIALKKGFATFYTEVPAAYLLAALAVKTLLGLEGKDITKLGEEEAERLVEKIGSVKVGDLACGSGTLLTASYYSLMKGARDLSYHYGLDVNLDELGRDLIEKNIYGIDALKYASQIAAINLGLIGQAKVSKENVYTIYLGYLQGKGSWLGSLELLGNRGTVAGILEYIEGGLEGAAGKVTLEGEEGSFSLPERFDMIIMNPPFTRATGRTEKKFGEAERGLFGFIAEEKIRKKLVERYGELRDEIRADLKNLAKNNVRYLPEALRNIINEKPGKLEEVRQYLDIGQAGEGLLFLYLASKYVGDGDVIAFVLPRGVLAGISWFLARILLAMEFHPKYIVVSSDPKGYNFSEGTSLSEALVIAKKASGHNEDEVTTFVNLLKKPRNMLEGIILGEEIGGKGSGTLLESGMGSVALIRNVDRKLLLDNIDNWNRFAAIPENELVDIFLSLAGSSAIKIGRHEVKIPTVRFNQLIDKLGIDAHQFHNNFEKAEIRTQYPIVYGGEEEVRKSMSVKFNAYAKPKTEKAGEIYEKFRGRVALPDRIRWNTAHVIAMLSEEPILSNIFYAVNLKNPDERRAEKALVLWLNTAWGLLSILANRQETMGGWSRLKMAQWRLLHVLDVSTLDNKTLGKLSDIYDKYADKQLRRIPEQFDPKNPDPVRLGIDSEFVKALAPNLRDDEIKNYLLELYGHIDISLKRWMGGS
jgi:hypothetical protein